MGRNNAADAQATERCNPLVEDAEAWNVFILEAPKKEVEEQLDRMLGLCVRLTDKAIPCPHVHSKYLVGAAVYEKRFGEAFIPF